MPRGRGLAGRGRWILVGVLAVLVVLLLSLRGLAGFYTDYLWFDALDHVAVWRQVLFHQIAMGAIFTVVFGAMLYASLAVADRVAPKFRVPGPEDELLIRYHDFVAPRQRLVRLGVAGLLALLVGLPVAGRWELWLLFRNRQDFGIEDPQFGLDVGFYMFSLPFLSFLVEWLFVSLIIIIGLTLVAHYLNGGIRIRAEGSPVTAAVKVHISVLLALLALVRTADYWFQRYELTLSSNGFVDGAGYTDVNARIPALNLLILISLFAAALLLFNIRRRGWALPAVAVGLWLFVQIVMGAIYPAFVQWRTVSPAESERESALIEHNIEATRQAYGLSAVDTRVYEYQDTVSADEVSDAEEMVRNVRLIDPLLASDSYERLQGERSFYQFPEILDVDRYDIDGETTQLVLGVRGLSLPELDSWEDAHVAFTHGYGLAASPAGLVDVEGEPVFVVGDLPLESTEFPASVDQPQVYYGEDLAGYSIVGATRDEVDYATANQETELTRYDGTGGVAIDSIVRRTAFALRFGQFEPLLSSLITSGSRVLYIRDVVDRVSTLAPFLEWDVDPYAAVIDGRVKFIIDGYTTSASFPYSESATNADREGSGFGDLNYVRNSVKAVVDSYSGEVTFYRTPVEDPLMDAYAQAFGDLFEPFSAMPENVLEHVRYPESLFRVQTSIWARYQVSNPQDFYDGQGSYWAVAQDPGRLGTGPDEQVVVDEETQTASTQEARVDPYHALLQLPGEDDVDWVNLRTYVNISADDQRKELSAMMVAKGDPDEYGELIVYEMDDDNVPGPALADERIRSDGAVSSEQTLLGDTGSRVRYGEMQLLPVGGSIVYVRPMYVIAEGSANVPTLEFVIVSQGRQVILARTLQEGLEELVDGDLSSVFDREIEPVAEEDVPVTPDTPPEDDPADPGEEDPVDDDPVDPGDEDPEDPEDPVDPGDDDPAERTVDEILAEVFELQAEADAALAEGSGGFEEYGRIQAEIRDLLEEAFELAGGDLTAIVTPAGRPGSDAGPGGEGSADDGAGDEETAAAG